MHGMYGAEIKSYSMERDGTESWVISRGIERWVTKCALDHVDSMRCDTTLSARRDGRVENAVSTARDIAHIPVEQRRWVYIPAVKRVDDDFIRRTKRVTTVQVW